MMGEIGSTIMRWQDETQHYDEAVGERLGLNAAERRCLGFLHGGPQPAGAIATAIGLTPAAVTSLVDRLEARGLLTRKRSEEDRRKVIIEATAETGRISEDYYGSIARDGHRRARSVRRRRAGDDPALHAGSARATAPPPRGFKPRR